MLRHVLWKEKTWMVRLNGIDFKAPEFDANRMRNTRSTREKLVRLGQQRKMKEGKRMHS